MRNIRTVFNQAISKKIIGLESFPFGKGKYVPPATKKAKKSLSIEEIEKIYKYTPTDAHEAWARDMWLFAYLANGMNIKDIALLKYESITGGVISYIRAKTKNSSKENLITIDVLVNEDLQRIIAKWDQACKTPKFYIRHPATGGSVGPTKLSEYQPSSKKYQQVHEAFSHESQTGKSPNHQFCQAFIFHGLKTFRRTDRNDFRTTRTHLNKNNSNLFGKF